MTTKSSFSEVHLDVDPDSEQSSVELEPDTPFRILLMGDFSGRPSAGWTPVEIDRDNFDDVLASLKPAPGGMTIGEIDHFHPDHIFRQKLFRELRDASRRQAEPAAQRQAESQEPQPKGEPAAPQRPPLPDLAPGVSLLDSMLEAAEPSAPPVLKPSRPPARRGSLESVVESFVSPYLVPKENPDVARAQAESDAESSVVMRTILHAPAFQAAEAAWRAVFQLVRAVETGTQLRLYLLDLSKAALAADLSAGDAEPSATPRQSRLARLLATGEPWSVVAGNYSFAQTAEDVELLGRLGRAMRRSGAIFLGEADPAGGGPEAENSASLWEKLRQSPEARWIGLTMPRFLLRLPYGKKANRIDSFEFDEMPGVPSHQHYLWGNPAFACVQMMAEAFASEGWQMNPAAHSQLDGLPLHIYEADGEKVAKPCAEVLLTESDLDWVMDQGYMSLASIRDSDSVRLVRFQSIASPAARLAARWE